MISDNQRERIATRLAEEIGVNEEVGYFVFHFARLPGTRDVDYALYELERTTNPTYKKAVHIVLEEIVKKDVVVATIPEYMKKHPCKNCGDGYLTCAQGLSFNLKCCCACDHPSRWETNPPYTKSEMLDMWSGKTIPPYTKKKIDEMPD